MLHHAAFGLDWRSDIALPGFDRVSEGAPSPIEVRRVDALAARGGGRPVNRGFVYSDGLRLAWRDEVVFDMTDGTRIEYCPGPDWTGIMPASFSSTVAALVLAWRGTIPFHACAVELDGRGVLIAGAAGAGKSTLTAGLLAAGAGFVADDLAAVSIDAQTGAVVGRGRRTIRLHRETAVALDAFDAAPVPDDPRGKWSARPGRRATAERLAVGAVLILGAGGEGRDTDVAAAHLPGHIFRPRWIDALPMRAALRRKVLAIAASVPVLAYPALTGFDPRSRAEHAGRAAALIRSVWQGDARPALR